MSDHNLNSSYPAIEKALGSTIKLSAFNDNEQDVRAVKARLEILKTNLKSPSHRLEEDLLQKYRKALSEFINSGEDLLKNIYSFDEHLR